MWLRCQIGSKRPLAKRKDVLRRLLAEEVVDPEDLVLVEDLVQLAVQLPGRREVGTEGLLHDDPAALDQVRVLEQVDHRQGSLGWDAEVVQAAQLVGAELFLGLRDGLPQGLGPTLARGPVQALGELRPALRVGPLPAVLRDGLAGELGERVAIVLLERGAHHLHLRQQAGIEEVQHAGEQLALGQVTGGSEQDNGRGGRHGSRLPGSAPFENSGERSVPLDT